LTHALAAERDALPLVLRPAGAADHPFIVDSWLLSYRGQAIARDAGASYVRDMKWLIRRLLERGRVLVAADADEPSVIWGWAATGDRTVLYVYVREQFRRNGIASALLAPYLARPDVTYCAKTYRDITIPRGWRYSFLAAVRIASE